MIIYLDTETSGLYPGQICQLSYIIQDKEKVQAKNFFFNVDYVEYGAYCVHGFSTEKLNVLSKGLRFSDHIKEIEKDLLSCDVLVCHNFAFDGMFLRREFERLNLEFAPKLEFCSMKKLTSICKISKSRGCGYKYPRLEEACQFFGINSREIEIDTKRLFNSEAGFHDARFDTTGLYLLMNYAFDNGYFSEIRGKL